MPDGRAEADGAPARRDGADLSPLDGGRRSVVVGPDEVWTARTGPAPTAAEVRREARRSFFAPIVLVAGLSTVLLLLFMAAVALLVWLRR